MPLTGKYDFKGIQKFGAKGIELALAATTWGAWIVASPFSKLLDFAIEALVNWLANHGLILIDVAVIYPKGEFDQSAFDKSMEEGLQRVRQGREKLTPEQGKAIDDKVIDKFRKLIRYTK